MKSTQVRVKNINPASNLQGNVKKFYDLKNLKINFYWQAS